MSGKHWCVRKVGGVVVQVQRSYAWVEVHLGESIINYPIKGT